MHVSHMVSTEAFSLHDLVQIHGTSMFKEVGALAIGLFVILTPNARLMCVYIRNADNANKVKKKFNTFIGRGIPSI